MQGPKGEGGEVVRDREHYYKYTTESPYTFCIKPLENQEKWFKIPTYMLYPGVNNSDILTQVDAQRHRLTSR